VPLKLDGRVWSRQGTGLDQTWRDFAGWRVNYDTVLRALCSIAMAPPAAWSFDRTPAFRTPAVFAKRPLK